MSPRDCDSVSGYLHPAYAQSLAEFGHAAPAAAVRRLDTGTRHWRIWPARRHGMLSGVRVPRLDATSPGPAAACRALGVAHPGRGPVWRLHGTGPWPRLRPRRALQDPLRHRFAASRCRAVAWTASSQHRPGTRPPAAGDLSRTPAASRRVDQAVRRARRSSSPDGNQGLFSSSVRRQLGVPGS